MLFFFSVHEDDAELVEKERKKEGGVELSEMDRKAIVSNLS